jgi:hypothetical protein
MSAHADGTDKAIGMAMAFGLLALVGAGLMLAGGTQQLQAWGFAAALGAAGLSVVALQLYA